MSRVLMLVSNAHAPDVRVAREARALIAAGHTVQVLAWDRTAGFALREEVDGVRTERIRVPSRHRLGWRQALRLPRFWRAAVRIAVKLGADVAHCHDLDTLPAGWAVKRALGCRLVLDAHEHYPDLAARDLPLGFAAAAALLQRALCRQVDAVITASTVLARRMGDSLAVPVVAVPNYPDPAHFGPRAPGSRAQLRRALGVDERTLLVGYVGGLHRNRALLTFVDAAGGCADMQFRVWGDGVQRARVARAAGARRNVRYEGPLDPSRLAAHLDALDVLYYGLCDTVPGVAYNAPNTVAQAMATGVPVLVRDIGDCGQMVAEARAGVLMSGTASRDIAQGLSALRDPTLRATLGANGRRAVEQRLNAAASARALTDLYQRLT